MEGNRAKLQEIADQHGGDIPVTQELLDRVAAFENANREFTRLEKRYLKLKQELEG